MTAYQTFLVPFDFSANAMQALRFAHGAAQLRQGEVILAHAMQTPLVGRTTPAISVDDIIDGLRKHLEERLEKLLHENGIRAQIQVHPQEIDPWLTRLQQTSPNPLVVLSRRGWSEKTTGIGDMAKRIVQHASAPVWLVGNSTRPIQRVLAAVDLDPRNLVVAGNAKAIAQQHGASLRLLHVRDTLRENGYMNEIAWPATSVLFEQVNENAVQTMSALVSSLREPGFEVEGGVATGSASATLLKAAGLDHADLVVCGKHSRGAFETLLFGSTSRDLARQLESHLLIC